MNSTFYQYENCKASQTWSPPRWTFNEFSWSICHEDVWWSSLKHVQSRKRAAASLRFHLANLIYLFSHIKSNPPQCSADPPLMGTRRVWLTRTAAGPAGPAGPAGHCGLSLHWLLVRTTINTLLVFLLSCQFTATCCWRMTKQQQLVLLIRSCDPAHPLILNI